MKLFVLAAAVVVSSLLALAEGVHVTLDDNIDSTAMTLEQLKATASCLCGDGPCNELIASYKQHYPLVVEEGCKRCNNEQKKTGTLFYTTLKEKMPEEFKKCVAKWDPKGIYFDTFLNNMKNY